MIQVIIAAVFLPFLILNSLGGIVSGIWLAFLGEWGILGYGVLVFFFSLYGLSIFLMGRLLFAMPSAHLYLAGHKILAAPFGFLAVLYTYILVTAWCVFMIALFLGKSDSDSLIPAAIWGYGAAVGPWASMSSMEQNAFSSMTTLFVQIASLLLLIMHLLLEFDFRESVIGFIVVMIVGMLIQLVIATAGERLISHDG